MKVQLVSDVHVEFHADGGRAFVESLDPTGVDVLVLAGDLANGEHLVPALGLFCERYRAAKVVYVHGNHEFHGSDRATTLERTRDALHAHSNLVWLDGATAIVEGRRFLGGTLWFPRNEAARQLRHGMADFSEIRDFETWVYAENARVRAFLERELRDGDVVVTHHLPSYRCVAKRFVGSPLNAFFVSDEDALIEARRPALWLHGHTHSSVDLRFGPTRVLCNPFGYARWDLNPEFSETLRVEA